MSFSFDDLATAATVGVSRRPVVIGDLDSPAGEHAGVLDSADPAAALLEGAALLTVARRAGFRPARINTTPTASASPAETAPEDVAAEATMVAESKEPSDAQRSGTAREDTAVRMDTAPELSLRAERALRQIGGAQLAPGFAAGDRELLADLLTAASAAGYVASAPLLPDLLDAAVRSTALRPAVVALLGARGRWLAGHRPDWQRVVDAARETAVTVPLDDPELWRTGSRSERHAYLTAHRERDPRAGRELLAADWAQPTGDERATLLAVLARGLSAQDEEFLDAALDDRVPAVRAVARRLLTRLPGSQFSQRATDRAMAALRLDRSGTRWKLVVSSLDLDAAAVRDGIDARRPSPAVGADAWLLTQIIAAAPLAGWSALFGLLPDEIVALPVEGNLGLDVHAGWRLAAVTQGSGQWAEALLAAGDPDGGGNRPPAAWVADERLAAVLPPERRTARLAALLASTGLNPGSAAVNRAIAEVGGGPVPWAAVLADAVVTVLGRAAPRAVLPGLPRGLLDLAARGLPATGGRDYAAELDRLADAYPQTWTPLLRKTAETILLRRAFLEEIR